ncbi:MAG TPA: ScyD/ScyE family protein [Thermomicrobiales bacterium]|nr:ScyD/ScyE family protein [Thermomicrobiales bacterium]
MQRRNIVLALIFLLTLAPAVSLGSMTAQDATPSAPDGATPAAGSPVASPVASSQGISLAVGGLINPRGMTWSPDGTMYVALAGSGGTTMGEADSAHEQEYGPFFSGNTASVVRVEQVLNVTSIGCPVGVAGGLPSTRGMSGHTQGPADVAFLDGQLYVLQDSGSAAATAYPDMPNGVYVVNADGSVTLVADIKKWRNENPVEHVPYDLTDESETFAMLPGDSFLWVLESNSGQVLQVTPDGTITRIADLSEGHPVPTGFALSGDGGVYVGFLTPAPYTDGSSKIVKIMPDGTVTDVWTGLTAVTGIAVGPDGTLYALEMATRNLDEAPFMLPGTGRIVRQTGPDSLAEVVVGLDFPIAMEMGPDNALYVSFPAFGAEQGLGGVLRVDLSAPQPMTVSPDILGLDQCDIATAAPSTPVPMDSMATPAATAMATPSDAAERANDDGKAATGAQAVQIHNFSFTPQTLEVPAGTTVTWTNLDSVAHTATADDGTFNSGNLNPNESFSFRFDTPGTYVYNCSYHPNMQGTIVVK